MRSGHLIVVLAMASCTGSGEELRPSGGAGESDPPGIVGNGNDRSSGGPGSPNQGGPDGGGTNEPTAPGPGVGLSAKYPNDVGIDDDPSVIFHSGFESDFAGWTYHTPDQALLGVDSTPGLANGGTKYLRASVSRAQLVQNPNISAAAQFTFPQRHPLVYLRFYARFVGNTAVPHHWVRIGGGNASYNRDGLANTVPPGDQGFWYDLDANEGDDTFLFYVYWHQMRSSRCNDGSATPGCPGDQGRTNYYGNVFNPANQSAFPRDQWFCVELMTKANTIGQMDGELAVYRNDQLVGEYKTGTPRGRWLRSSFHSWGQYFIDQGPFEGFNFRTSADVAIKKITLDTYYQLDTLDRRIANGHAAPGAQTILYDDVVVATERIGCKTQ